MKTSDLPDIAVDVGRQALRDNLGALASELAFRFFLAIFPFFIFLGALGAVIASWFDTQNPAGQVVQILGESLPSSSADIIRRQLEQTMMRSNPGLLSVGAIGTILFATGGTNALIRTMNRAYGVRETRPIWKRYPMAAGMTILAGISTIAAFALFVAGQFYGRAIAASLGFGETFTWVISIGRWPIAFLFLLIGVGVMYWAAPNMHVKFLWVLPGAAVFGAVWLAVTFGFGIYIRNFGSYTATYGAMAGVVIVLIWFYLSALALLLGAELNQAIDERVDPARVDEERREKGETPSQDPRALGRMEEQQRRTARHPLRARTPADENADERRVPMRPTGGRALPAAAAAIAGGLIFFLARGRMK